MKKIQLFAALTKVDELKREVWGLATAEIVDKDGEIFDYVSSKPYFQDWSLEISSATSGRSLGNVREMHQSSAVGKLVDLKFDDEQKTVAIGARIVDEAAWQKCVEGVYTGFSIGGRYVNFWPDGEYLRFTAQPAEISVVDNPSVPNAHFTAIKRDGSTEVRKFAKKLPATSYQPPDRSDLLEADSRKPAATKEESMKPEQEEKIDKAVTQSASSLEKIGEIDRKLESLEAGLKELADAFRKFSEGFAKSFTQPEKRVARTSVTVSKEDDGRVSRDSSEHRAEGGRFNAARREGIQADADPGFLEAMKSAHSHPVLGG